MRARVRSLLESSHGQRFPKPSYWLAVPAGIQMLVFKKRRRKSSKTTKTHRREVTLLRVTDIVS